MSVGICMSRDDTISRKAERKGSMVGFVISGA
jgi:hypothetical protein